MAIEELLQVVPPPKSPVDKEKPFAWEAIQRRIQTRLPDDLREFGIHYGTGTFVDGEIFVVSPFASFYQEYVDSVLQGLRMDKATRIPGEFTFDVYPDSPGLFP